MDAQFFSPPYLFESSGLLASRPQVDWAPEDIAYNASFELDVSSTTNIARATLVKTGATTHSFNMEQRFVELNFSQVGDRLTVSAPVNNRIATPGYYLLSIIDSNGVVSESEIVSLLNSTASNDVQNPPTGGSQGGPGTVYEDAEDGTTDGWVVYDKTPAGASVNNVLDNGERVIELSGSGTSNGYRLGGTSAQSGWNNTSDSVMSWRMKASEAYVVYVAVETTGGFRYLQYDFLETDRLLYRDGYIHHGLGETSRSGNWVTINRNLADDVAAEPGGNTLLAVHGYLARGSFRLDDITLYP